MPGIETHLGEFSKFTQKKITDFTILFIIFYLTNKSTHYCIKQASFFFFCLSNNCSLNSLGVQVLLKNGCCNNSIASGLAFGSLLRHKSLKFLSSFDHFSGVFRGGTGFVLSNTNAFDGDSKIYGGYTMSFPAKIVSVPLNRSIPST